LQKSMAVMHVCIIKAMDYTKHRGKLMRLVPAVMDYDTGEIVDDLQPRLQAPRQRRGAFMEYVKINALALSELKRVTTSARWVFQTMASACKLGNTLHASQAAIAAESGCTQPTVSRAIRELIDAGLVRIESERDVAFYRLSPYVVWRGANADHRAAQVEWDKTKNNVVPLNQEAAT